MITKVTLIVVSPVYHLHNIYNNPINRIYDFFFILKSYPQTQFIYIDNFLKIYLFI